MDSLVKGLVLLTTIALVLDLFDFFSYTHIAIICYILLALSCLYFLVRKYKFNEEE